MITAIKPKHYDKVDTLWAGRNLSISDFSKIKNELSDLYQVFVFIDKNIIKGFICVRNFNQIEDLVVKLEFQKQGIERKLINYVRRRKTFINLKLNKNNTNEIEFYRNLEFKIIAENMGLNNNELWLAWNKGCKKEFQSAS